MRIDGPIPFAVAQSYDAHQTINVAKEISATPIQQLVAAQVEQSASFEAVAASDLQSLQLYTRCADRIEAATRIATGHLLNIQA